MVLNDFDRDPVGLEFLNDIHMRDEASFIKYGLLSKLIVFILLLDVHMVQVAI